MLFQKTVLYAYHFGKRYLKTTWKVFGIPVVVEFRETWE